VREIKFRAISLRSGEFVYGSLLLGYYSTRYGCKIDAIVFPSPNGGRDRRERIVSGTHEQYTGLKDKNGVEIYECDIVSTSFTIYESYPSDETDDVTRTGVVKYYPSKGFVLARAKQVSNVDGEIKKNISPMNITTSNSIVIGNIHQNPELLETNK